MSEFIISGASALEPFDHLTWPISRTPATVSGMQPIDDCFGPIMRSSEKQQEKRRRRALHAL
ncbi:hypothetical protein IE4771_PB00162 (plasmid) [Rhizobium etli bv. mimosae str. IE4771]|uniref:Uncharacterized protein n=1 Tax=Rhizobium etli bv. mimosae str. IE4771 TaxID=1432050 RepID=A0A060I423_RHIET|nr:hypothetical protein IE4771_PB00162 [Rhizobium sp. IE4771]